MTASILTAKLERSAISLSVTRCTSRRPSVRYPVRRKLISARHRLQPSSQSISSFLCSSFPWKCSRMSISLAGPGRRVLCATDQVESIHPELLRIEIRRDPLCHAKTPAPVFIRSPIHRPQPRIRSIRSFVAADDRKPTAWSKSAFMSTRRISPPVSSGTSITRSVSARCANSGSNS